MRTSPSSALRTSEIGSSFEAIAEDPRWILVQRVAASEHLRTSLRLRDFLLYIAECAIRETPENATEQQIGIHVFQRVPGYNCSEDSIVRTHARLLRQKLAAYFATEGATETMVIEVPKGHYLPVFHPRETQMNSTQPPVLVVGPASAMVSPQLPEARTSKWKTGILRGLPITLLLALVGVVIGAAWPRHPVVVTALRSPFDSFWAPFLSGRPPLVIYSNARFFGDSRTGMRYQSADAAPIKSASGRIIDHYTGIGEVAAVYQLTRMFDAHQASFVLKRSLLVTWDEAKLTNLIFIGSTAENPSLKVLPSTRDFTMTTGQGYSGVINQHPRADEPSLYSRPEEPLDRDYAIIALMPAIEPGRQMLVLSGLTTLGTQAAVEYVCRKESIAELFKAAGFPKDQIRPFEAVIEVSIGGGVPLQTKLLAVRSH